MTTKQRMLCKKEVAHRLGVHINTLSRWMKDDAMRVRLGAKKIGHHWRFIASRVELFMESATY